jgi:pimeloyl-ACP methyl ester carboxylesterase
VSEPSPDPISISACHFDARLVPAADGVSLRVLHWKPLAPTDRAPLIFVAGWVSVVEGWADTLRAIAPTREVFYIETREKRSAQFDHDKLTPDDFRIELLAEDMRRVCAQLPVDTRDCIASGSSLGATTLIEAMKNGGLTFKAGFFIGPNAEFHVPWFTPILMAVPASSYHILKYFVMWYLRNFRVDAKKEPEQIRRYEETLKSAHPVRIQRSTKAFSGYQVWPDLESIAIPVGLAYAPSDTLHGVENIARMQQTLPQARALACPSNKYLHSGAVADELERYLATLGIN